MSKFQKKVLMNQMAKAERQMINSIKHKLQFGGLNEREEVLATLFLRTARIGRRYVSIQYQSLIPVA